MFKKRIRGQYRRKRCSDISRQQFDKPVNLDSLPVGSTGTVMAITGERKLRRRLMEMGLLEGSRLRVVKFAPGGDPIEIKVNDYFLSLRKSEAARIVVLPKSTATNEESRR
jgi:Fe2+ transport system protein FeoA